MTPKSTTYAFTFTKLEKTWEGNVSGKSCRNQISVLNIITLRPIQDFYIQIPHKKVNVSERNSRPGEIFVKPQHESEWYVKL